MLAGELCVRDVVTANADETVVEAARRMSQYRVGDLIVVERALPIGIVTDRDLVVNVLAWPERKPAEVRVIDVMQRELVLALEEDDVEHVLERMRVHAVRRIPVVDRRGQLQGILTLEDILFWMGEQLQAVTKLLDRQSRGPLMRVAPRFG